jgi:Uma2 family endonuclease
MGMSTALVSLEEYLETAYSPDREYVDGAVLERHVGEFPHSFTQGRIVWYIGTSYPRLFALPEQRVRTIPGRRSRVPDVCITLEKPATDVIETPPFIVIEILSKRDEMSNVLEKLEEYAGFGVPHIWLVDPRRQKGFRYMAGRLEEVQEAFVTESPVVRLPLEEIFRGL